jgi:hypothetical protein
MRICEHLGTSFEVWSGRHTWFWFVAEPPCSGASIGAAGTERDAICDAYLSIEEMAARWPSSTKSRGNGQSYCPGNAETQSSLLKRSRLG